MSTDCGQPIYRKTNLWTKKPHYTGFGGHPKSCHSRGGFGFLDVEPLRTFVAEYGIKYNLSEVALAKMVPLDARQIRRLWEIPRVTVDLADRIVIGLTEDPSYLYELYPELQ